MSDPSNIGTNASIPISYAQWIARVLQLAPENSVQLLRGSGLAIAALEDDSQLISVEQLVAVLTNALELDPRPGFGLRLGAMLTPPSHGSLGFLALSSPDLHSAIAAFADFGRLRLPLFTMTLEKSENGLALAIDINIAVEKAVYRAFLEAAMVTLQSVAEYIVGRPIDDAQVTFNFCPSQANYSDYLHPTITFNSAVNSVFNSANNAERGNGAGNRLFLPTALAQTRNISSNHQHYCRAIEQCQQELTSLDAQQNSTTAQVKELLLSHPPGQLSEAQIASALCITKRTLARRLKKEGSHFRALRETYMASIARGYLSQTPLSVEAIAELLGYHDSSSFRRAFKQWTALTPQQYRQSIKD